MNDTATKETIDKMPPKVAPPREGILQRIFLMRSTIDAAEQTALRKGQLGFPEYEAARSLLIAAEKIDDVAERLMGTILLLQKGALFAARGLALRKQLVDEANVDTSDTARIWQAVLALPNVTPTWNSLSALDRERVDKVVLGGVTAAFAASSQDELLALKLALTRVVRRVFDLLEDETRPLARVRTQRALRWAGLGVALAALVWLGRWAEEEYGPEPSGPANRALHKSVSISSNWRTDIFPPEGIVDGEINQVGCHTHSEPNPWVQIDLGRKQTVSRVVVTNRLDGLTERALPLAVQLSSNGRKFTEVARQATDFRSWTATFAPTKTRYVRLTALNGTGTILHLNEVEVY